MTELNELFKCNICGNVVEITHEGVDSLVCCGEDMEKLTVNEANPDNFHYVHIETTKKVEDLEFKKISVKHEMTPEHYIEFIVLETATGYQIKHLKPGEKPEAHFAVTEPVVAAYEYCNLHGLWVGKV